MSKAAEIADRVVEVLSGTDLGLAFTASRAYVLPQDLQDLAGVRVIVLPFAVGISALDMNRRLASDWGISVVVLAKVPDALPATIDPLMTFVEAIVRTFASGPNPPIGRCANVENQPLYDPTMLDSQGVFSSSLVFTFRSTK